MAWQIKINYITGNSFDSYTEEETLELVNKNLEIAKSNLVRISEHNKMYQNLNGYSRIKTKTLKDYSNFDWFTGSDHSIILKTDDNQDLQISAFWVGYFENLNYIELVPQTLELEGMRIDI